MKFEEILPALREGKTIKREVFCHNIFIKSKKGGEPQLRIGSRGCDWMYKPDLVDLFAMDWAIVEE